MTPKRRAALRKAQLESARQRKGVNKAKVAVGVTAAVGTVAVLGAGVVRHKASGSSLSVSLNRGRVAPQPTLYAEGTRQRRAQLHERNRLVKVSGHKSTTPILTAIAQRDTGMRQTQVGAMARLKNVVGINVAYHHKPASGQQMRDFVMGRKIASGGPPPQAIVSRPPSRKMSAEEKNAIPYYRPSTRRHSPAKSWPHTTPELAKEQNVGIKAGTHYIHPVLGVRPFPKTAKGRKALEERIARWTLGADRGTLPDDWFHVTAKQVRRRKGGRR